MALLGTGCKALLIVAVVALVGVQGAEVECEICTRVAGVVEGVLLKNATTTNTFQRVAAALCLHLPEDMIDTVGRLRSPVGTHMDPSRA